jgi:hypothetical protein
MSSAIPEASHFTACISPSPVSSHSGLIRKRLQIIRFVVRAIWYFPHSNWHTLVVDREISFANSVWFM